MKMYLIRNVNCFFLNPSLLISLWVKYTSYNKNPALLLLFLVSNLIEMIVDMYTDLTSVLRSNPLKSQGQAASIQFLYNVTLLNSVGKFCFD